MITKDNFAIYVRNSNIETKIIRQVAHKYGFKDFLNPAQYESNSQFVICSENLFKTCHNFCINSAYRAPKISLLAAIRTIKNT